MLSDPGPILDDVLDSDAWESAIASAPAEAPLTADEVSAALTAMGDFADLKSPYTAGHSRAVAALAADAARRAGLGPDRQRDLHHAGLVHDLARLGVSNAVWDKREPLTTAELERVRIHPYFTERILARVPGLAGVAALAGAHHERLDGSGYTRGLTRAPARWACVLSQHVHHPVEGSPADTTDEIWGVLRSSRAAGPRRTA